MFTFLIVLLGFQIIGIYRGIVRTKPFWEESDFDKENGPVPRFFKYLIAGVILGAISVSTVDSFIEHEYETITKTIYLQNMNDGIGTKGSFFLGSGTIDQVQKYNYYIKRGNAYYFKSMDAAGIPIIYDSGRPRIEWRVKRDTGTYYFGIQDTDVNHKKTIYVPRGSIKNNFTFDAQ